MLRSPVCRQVALLLLAASASLAAGAEALRVAVASNFRPVAEALAADLARSEGFESRISSAASGVLAAQIRAGAPFDLFLAADRQRPIALRAAGVGRGSALCYARGRLVLLGADSVAALADPKPSLAIANPRSAPYGKAAMAVLARPEFAPALQRRLVRGANVQQALQFFDSGAADLALVARSLAADRGLLIPGDWHPPIDQFALVLSDDARATRWLAALRAEDYRATLERSGYEACP
ncbi:MAG: molybdate ABC transporter substrate-binding protein [Halieaceae bacterium]|jgi:molybdate transport system substrate-binding protein|nr:molybdate ABC transporter substrate-binding protein [Halieaceae bacterium]